jgi:UDP-GlcNAc3NAcA epimerase
MPEEINRIMCDHVSTLLFSPTKSGYDNLIKEGFMENNQAPYTFDNPKVYHCGDVMYDNSLFFSAIAEQKTTVLNDNKLSQNNFILATIHRNNNTDDALRLNAIFSAMNKIATENKITIVLPLHPRTSKLLQKNLSQELFTSLKTNEYIKIIPPVSFLEMIALEKNATLVMTDSGGVQKEAFFFQKPCIVLRSETEWVELVNCGSAKITDADETKILDAFNYFNITKQLTFPEIFGNGKAAEFICVEILKQIN